MFIDGIGIAGYRSFGEIQYIGPFSKINLFAGKNNSGKSNILIFFNERYKQSVELAQQQNKAVDLKIHEPHIGKYKSGLRVAFGIIEGSELYKMVVGRFRDAKVTKSFNKVINDLGKNDIQDIGWVSYSQTGSGLTLSAEQIEEIINNTSINKKVWEEVDLQFTGGRVQDIRKNVNHVLSHMAPKGFPTPNVELISAIREVGKPGSRVAGYNGEGIIDRLFELQNPTIEKQEDELLFIKINDFLKKVISNDTAIIKIPHDKKMINVQMNEKTLPLSFLGMGVHETIIIAVACTLIQDEVVCIEEPELHLHPHMERQLIRYLIENTNNQYFITTHSAHILDTPEASIFHVSLENDQSIVKWVSSDKDKFNICADLGYKASDILQANCIIWVEGPSDRIYLKFWIESFDRTLKEGLHYSIMFYGGRLLSHLSANDSEVDNFISLRRINRYISILIDSDKNKEENEINESKKRVQDEFGQGPGFAWITQGREIENYLDSNILDSLVKQIHKGARKITAELTESPYEKTLNYNNTNGNKLSVDKVKVAHEFINNNSPNLDILDLRVKIEEIVQFIKNANQSN